MPLTIIVIVLVAVGLLGREPVVRDFMGNFAVSLALFCGLNRKKTRHIRKIKVTDSEAEGGSAAISHVVVATTGIFIIEVKKVNGRISGTKDDKVWARDLYGSKYQEPNPFILHAGYIKELAKRTAQPAANFRHIVVFIGDNTLKTKDELPENLVLSGRRMLARFKSYKDDVYSVDQLDAICTSLR